MKTKIIQKVYLFWIIFVFSELINNTFWIIFALVNFLKIFIIIFDF